MTPQELKNSILQLAIQGKLVEQRAEEGTAAELVEKILATKNAKGAKKDLTRSRGARGEKKTSALSASPREKIPDDEKPFDIPESWEWVRLGDVASIERGSGIKRSETSSRGFPCVRYGEIYTTYGYSFTSTKSFVTETVASLCHKANHGDVLCTLTGEWKEEIAKATAYLGKSPIAVGGDLAKISSHVFNPVLLVYFFFAPFMIQQKASKANGTMIVHIGKEAVSNLLIPLPPLAEQKRIVAKIEELLPLIDRYEKAWSKLEDFNRRFPVDMQKSVLQMAIQGKLVDQRPEEGTGEELYRQIQAERARLIESGDIKAAKPFEPISDDEKPFEIPESWTWVRFGDLGSYKKGPFGSALTKSMFVPKGANSVKVYEQKNAIQKDATLGEYYIRRDYFETKMSGFEVHPGDVIVSCAGTIGETYVLPEGIEQGIINQALMRMKIFAPMYIPYFLIFFDVVLKQSARANSKGSAIKNIPPFEILKNYLVPLPPLAEQKRIVAKLDEILPLCERLK